MTAERRISRSPAWREAYRRYLRSDEWAARKRSYFETHPRSCKPCWDDWNEAYKDVPDKDRPTGMLFEPVDLHHLTYVNVKGVILDDGTIEITGREQDADLVPLCRQHHEKAHRLELSLKRGSSSSEDESSRRRYQELRDDMIRKYPECELCGNRSRALGYVDISELSEYKWLVIPVCFEHGGPRGRFQLEQLRSGVELLRWVNEQSA